MMIWRTTRLSVWDALYGGAALIVAAVLTFSATLNSLPAEQAASSRGASTGIGAGRTSPVPNRPQLAPAVLPDAVVSPDLARSRASAAVFPPDAFRAAGEKTEHVFGIVSTDGGGAWLPQQMTAAPQPFPERHADPGTTWARR